MTIYIKNKKGFLILIGLVIGFVATSCSQPDPWNGIWHGEIEAVPGFKTPFEFEVYAGTRNGSRGGRFELVELMANGPFRGVKVSDSVIALDMGDGWTFNGTLSEKTQSITGILSGPEQPDTLHFIRSNQWSSAKAARVNANGNVLTSWRYEAPVSTNDGWQTSALRDESVSDKVLNKLFQDVIKGEELTGLDALLVAQRGKLVLEEYFHIGAREKIHSIQSGTKSITSLLFGIALDEGLIKDLESPIQSYFPQYVDTMKADAWDVSLRHALMMAASLDWKENIPYTDPLNDAVRMNNSNDMYHFVLSRHKKQDESPGTTFMYNSGISVLLGGVLKQATGLSADAYAAKTLFNRLGIENYFWMSLRGQTHTGGGLYLRPRDLLKIGQMVLDGGRWSDRQIVPESWIKESTDFYLKTSASNTKDGYGYQWWRGSFNFGHSEHPFIFAAGYGGQFLWIVPDLELVIVALHHMGLPGKGISTITTKYVEEIILPALVLGE